MTVMGEQVEVCEFTTDGMRIARNYLTGIRAGGWTPLPSGLLTEHTYSQPVGPEVCVEERAFANRREAGQYLAAQLEPLGPMSRRCPTSGRGSGCSTSNR